MWKVEYVEMAKKVWRDNYVPPPKKKGKTVLPQKIKEAMVFLASQLELNGPEQQSWPNYSKLRGKNLYHCHLDKSKKWVVCWREEPLTVNEIGQYSGCIRVVFIGTHENAPY